jgi:hypothetical protein
MSAATTRVVEQAYRFELDPDQAQRVLLAKSVGASRFVYNWGLEQSHLDYGLTGKRPRLGELKSRLVELKQGECPWLYEVSAHIGESALKDLNAAFERFLKGQGAEGWLPALQAQGRTRLGPDLRGDARRASFADAEYRTGQVEGDALEARLRGPDLVCDDPPTRGSLVRLALRRARARDR